MKKSVCKTQLRSRMRRTRSPKERGKALGAYQKCLKSGRRGARGGWGQYQWIPRKGQKRGFHGGEDVRGRRGGKRTRTHKWHHPPPTTRARRGWGWKRGKYGYWKKGAKKWADKSY